MITTSKELIAALEAKFQTKVSCICCLEKSCIKSPRCTAYHTIELLDFDKIKDTICHNKRIESVASVDGILERNDTLCFVELKSWENYLKYQKPKAETDIQAQLDTYDLNSKLIESMNICVDESENPDFFKNNISAFILVTDINVEVTPMDNFRSNLIQLSQTSTKWHCACNKLSQNKLAQIKGVNTYYIYCRDFDSYILNNI